MPLIYLTEYNTKCCRVEIENNDLVKILKHKNTYDDDTIILRTKLTELFYGKSDLTNMLIKLGSLDYSVFNGKTILLKISEENNKNRYLYIDGDKIYSFINNDLILTKVANMGNNMIPYSTAVGEENVYFLSPHCNYTKRVIVRDVDLLKTNGNSVDPFDYHLENHGPDRFENLLEFTCIHSS